LQHDRLKVCTIDRYSQKVLPVFRVTCFADAFLQKKPKNKR